MISSRNSYRAHRPRRSAASRLASIAGLIAISILIGLPAGLASAAIIDFNGNGGTRLGTGSSWSSSAGPSLPAAQAAPAPPVAPALQYGVNPYNTNISPYVGVYAHPSIRWKIAHTAVGIDNPALVLDSRGVLYSQSHAPVSAATGQNVSFLTMPFARDSTPAINSAGDIYHWENGRLHAYHADGSTYWTGPTTNFSDGAWVKVGADDSVFAVGGDGLLRAYTAGGTLKWTHQGSAQGQPAAIDGGGNLYWSSGYANGQFISLDSAGNTRWTSAWTWNFSPMKFAPDGHVYATDNYGTVAYVRDAATGSLLHQQPNLDGGIQAIGPDNTLYSTSYQDVQATDPLGNVIWHTSLPPNTFLSTLVVDAAGQVFCTDEANRLLAFSSSGVGLWTLQLPVGNAQSLPPVIGPDGSIYVLSGGMLVAVTGDVVPEPASAAMLGLAGVWLLSRRRIPARL